MTGSQEEIVQILDGIQRLLAELTALVHRLRKHLDEPPAGHPVAEVTAEPEPQDPLRSLWAGLVRERSELAAVPKPASLDPAIADVLLRLPGQDRVRLLDANPGLAQFRPASPETALDRQVSDVIGDMYPGIRAALTGIGAIARNGTGLGRIHLTTSVAGPWLRPLAAADIDVLWEKLLTQLTRFARPDLPFTARRDALIRLDMNMRTVVPAQFAQEDAGAVARIRPPAPDSAWAAMLADGLADIQRFCAVAGFRVGHARPGSTLRDSEECDHVDNSQSLRQCVDAAAQDAFRVLWPLCAWTCQEAGAGVTKARVVYGHPQGFHE